nr:PaaI family thioesterase [Micromonospora sp. DSM 115978]
VMELGLRIEVDGDDLTGSAAVFPEICVPGTRTLRTSVLATWADVITGTLAMVHVAPRIPLTLDLDTHVVQPAADGDLIAVDASVVKLGRTVLVCQARFRNATSGGLVAVAYASFVASPNPGHVFPAGFLQQRLELPPRLSVPLAQRVGGTVVTPGTVDVPRRPDGLNASGAIQGGL